MRDAFNSAPKTRRIENSNSQLELFKKNPEEFLSSLKRYSSDDVVNRKMWQLLKEIGVSNLKETGELNLEYNDYSPEDLKELLKKELKKKEAA